MKISYYTLISSISSGTILYADIVPPNLKLGEENILKTSNSVKNLWMIYAISIRVPPEISQDLPTSVAMGKNILLHFPIS